MHLPLIRVLPLTLTLPSGPNPDPEPEPDPSLALALTCSPYNLQVPRVDLRELRRRDRRAGPATLYQRLQPHAHQAAAPCPSGFSPHVPEAVAPACQRLQPHVPEAAARRSPGALHAARTEPHIVKYNHEIHSGFRGIGTHQDGET